MLKYLTATAGYSIVFNDKRKDELLGYAADSWAKDLDSRRSTVAPPFVQLNIRVVSWNIKHQQILATSCTETEYTALFYATQEAIWLRLLLTNMGCASGQLTKTFEDNQGCIALVKKPVLHSRAKHIDIKFHFLCENVKDGVIELEYKPTGK